MKTVPTKVIFDFVCKKAGGTLRRSDKNSESSWFPQNQVLDMIKAPSNVEKYKAFLEYTSRPVYLEYITKPEFELKTKRCF